MFHHGPHMFSRTRTSMRFRKHFSCLTQRCTRSTPRNDETLSGLKFPDRHPAAGSRPAHDCCLTNRDRPCQNISCIFNRSLRYRAAMPEVPPTPHDSLEGLSRDQLVSIIAYSSARSAVAFTLDCVERPYRIRDVRQARQRTHSADPRSNVVKARDLGGQPQPECVCQSAFKFDPVSASNFDPFERRVLAVALASSELAGVAETGRARAA